MGVIDIRLISPLGTSIYGDIYGSYCLLINDPVDSIYGYHLHNPSSQSYLYGDMKKTFKSQVKLGREVITIHLSYRQFIISPF